MKGWTSYFLYFKVLMSFVYLLMGAAILFSDVLLLPINRTGRIIFGIVLLLYGIFRLYSSVLKTRNDEK